MKEGFSHPPSVSGWPMQHLLPCSRLLSPMSAGPQTPASYPLTITKQNKNAVVNQVSQSQAIKMSASVLVEQVFAHIFPVFIKLP